MCLPKPPTIQAPAPPAVPLLPPDPPKFGGDNPGAADLASRRRGRSSLRIDLASGDPAGDGTGLNIPT